LPNLTVIVLAILLVFTSATNTAESAAGEEKLQRYTGDFWESDEAFAAEVRVIDGKLWAVHSPTRRNELVPAGPDRFEMVGLPARVYVEYTMDASGVIEMRRIIDGQERGRFRPFTPRQVTAEQLQEYTGDYLDPESGFGYLLTLEEGGLTFRSGASPVQELTPLFDDTFEHPDVGSFIFARNADGAITGFSLHSRQAPVRVFEKRRKSTPAEGRKAEETGNAKSAPGNGR